MSTMIHRGGCLCGAVTYQVSGDPLWSAHCHCATCRRHCGSVIASYVAFALSDFTVTAGTMAEFASSPGVRRSFCATCGSPLSYQSNNLANEIHLFLGSLDKPEDYPAEIHVNCQEQLPWLELDDTAPRWDALP